MTGYASRRRIAVGWGGNHDAFSRLRTSHPTGIFDAQFTYALHPLLFEPITAETGAAIAHDATNRAALMTFASTPTGGKAYMQTYEHFRYQPGKSHGNIIANSNRTWSDKRNESGF